MQQKLKPHGVFPVEPVFKAFKILEYAEEFINEGRFQMGSLNKYRRTEDEERKDVCEGRGHIRVPGKVVRAHFDANDSEYFAVTEEPGYRDVHTELGNPVYIFSTSLSGVDLNYIASKFGPYIVRINDPKQLAVDITEYLMLRPEKYAGGIQCEIVSYNHGGIVEEGLDNYQRITLSYSQKPDLFSDEREFRYIAINKDKISERVTHDYIEINLEGPISYAEIIEVPVYNKSLQPTAKGGG